MPGFPRTYRLVSKQDFQSVFVKPRKVTYQFLTALYRPNQKPFPRLGIIIGKHFIKHAVDRNRARRVIRESFRHSQAALKGLDIIVLMRSECTALCKKVGKKALREDIDNLWHILITSSKRA